MKHLVSIFILFLLFSCKSEKQKLTDQILLNEKKLFNDSTKMMDPKVANDELEAYKKYSVSFPKDSSAPIYLYKAADLAHGMRKNKEAVDLYKQFISNY